MLTKIFRDVNMKAERRHMGRKISGVILIIFLLYTSADSWSGRGISIIHMTDGIQTLSLMGPDQMKPHATHALTLDPNFAKDGIQQFEGIDLRTLMGKVQADPFNGITIVGTDQYIGYIPWSLIETHQILLAWFIDSTPISPLKGGPLKVVYPAEKTIHPNCYTWYVDVIFTDNFYNSELIIEYVDHIQTMSQKELDDLSNPVENTSVSLPPGCRDFYPELPDNFTAVNLKNLLALYASEPAGTIEFIPWVGAGITMDRQLIEDHVYIVSGMGKKAVPPVFGGPFSVMFPMETPLELIGKVPESGALFFLKKIRIQ